MTVSTKPTPYRAASSGGLLPGERRLLFFGLKSLAGGLLTAAFVPLPAGVPMVLVICPLLLLALVPAVAGWRALSDAALSADAVSTRWSSRRLSDVTRIEDGFFEIAIHARGHTLPLLLPADPELLNRRCSPKSSGGWRPAANPDVRLAHPDRPVFRSGRPLDKLGRGPGGMWVLSGSPSTRGFAAARGERGMDRPERFSLLVGRPLVALSWLARPAVWSLTASSNAVLALFGHRTTFTEAGISAEELHRLVQEAARAGEVEPRSGEMDSRANEATGRGPELSSGRFPPQVTAELSTGRPGARLGRGACGP